MDHLVDYMQYFSKETKISNKQFLNAKTDELSMNTKTIETKEQSLSTSLSGLSQAGGLSPASFWPNI